MVVVGHLGAAGGHAQSSKGLSRLESPEIHPPTTRLRSGDPLGPILTRTGQLQGGSVQAPARGMRARHECRLIEGQRECLATSADFPEEVTFVHLLGTES